MFGSNCKSGTVTMAIVSTATAKRLWTTWRPPTIASAVTRIRARWWQHPLKTPTRMRIIIQTSPDHWVVWVESAGSTDQRRTVSKAATRVWNTTWCMSSGLRSCHCVKKRSVLSHRLNVKFWMSLTQRKDTGKDKTGRDYIMLGSINRACFKFSYWTMHGWKFTRASLNTMTACGIWRPACVNLFFFFFLSHSDASEKDLQDSPSCSEAKYQSSCDLNCHAASDLKCQSTSDIKNQSTSDAKYQSAGDVECCRLSDSKYQCNTDTKYQSVYIMSDQKDECIIATEVRLTWDYLDGKCTLNSYKI